MHAYVFGPSPAIPWPVPESEIDELREDWIDAIRSHPVAYLERV